MGHRAERRGAHVIEMTPNMLCAAASTRRCCVRAGKG